jgi:hypothetical protein
MLEDTLFTVSWIPHAYIVITPVSQGVRYSRYLKQVGCIFVFPSDSTYKLDTNLTPTNNSKYLPLVFMRVYCQVNKKCVTPFNQTTTEVFVPRFVRKVQLLGRVTNTSNIPNTSMWEVFGRYQVLQDIYRDLGDCSYHT